MGWIIDPSMELYELLRTIACSPVACSRGKFFTTFLYFAEFNRRSQEATIQGSGPVSWIFYWTRKLRSGKCNPVAPGVSFAIRGCKVIHVYCDCVLVSLPVRCMGNAIIRMCFVYVWCVCTSLGGKVANCAVNKNFILRKTEAIMS